MRKLPTSLQPAWPVLKKAHILMARVIGAISRRLPDTSGRRVPRRGADLSRDTVSLDGQARFWPVGPPETIARRMPQGSPDDHWVFAGRIHDQVPERYVLDLSNGVVVGTEATHITEHGVLDFETSGYFGTNTWLEQPLFLRPRLPVIEHFPGSLVSLATRGTSSNYYHFLFDAISRWGILTEAMNGFVPDGLYVNSISGYQRQLLAMLGLDRIPVVEPTAGRAIRADRLLVPSIPNMHLAAPASSVEWLRRHLPAKHVGGKPERLYITRGSRRYSRCVVNEDQVVATLARFGFVVFDPGAHSVQEQIDHFAAARVVVSPHGAGLSNLVFAEPGVKVLEIFAPGYVHLGLWAIAEAIPESRYAYLVGQGRQPPEGSGMTGIYDDIRVDIDQLVSVLDGLMQ